MTNLNTVNVGQNRFCGPAVLSILTGKSTDECALVISRINGKYNVTGVQITDLIKAVEKMGFRTEAVVNSVGVSLYRTLVTLVHKDGMYIVMVTGHFVCIEVKDKQIYLCDNHTKEPIPAASSSRLCMQVLACYKVVQLVTFEPEIVEKKIDTIKHVSSTYLECFNLINAAKHHKLNCSDPSCNVSLTVLKATVLRLLLNVVDSNEYNELTAKMNEVTWM